MPILDFKEIPEAHKATGLQDTFELFARDFLSFLGYKILIHPDRGADGGADLIVEEKRTGIGGETLIRWLVSCKHKAHSGNSVSPIDDSNIFDRVSSKKCHGFIGFYSTLPSSGLSSFIEGFKDRIEYQIFDRERIEKELLHSARGLEIAERYFPLSLSKWKVNTPQPAKIFADAPSLTCMICNKELLDQKDKGIITLWKRIKKDYEKDPKVFEYIFWTCRGNCDSELSRYIHSKNQGLIDGWEDISDVIMPTIFIKWVVTIINELHTGTLYSDEAVENLKHFLLNVYPFACRHLTDKEKEKLRSLMMIPSYLGGLGYDN
ncbi:restriction endonuclease [Acinetobacter baumannii]|uniref:restriction endonuclease n=1 Tax=Acinetobacter baumannii TaxID=470 RepID=UPI001C0DA7EF|nr:restriction endonuclease [Acinetobacter baumannii]MBU3082497.1 restriction endonuclease [Acinetobacter baumannii]MDC5116119.1 restriction endonuclease [Acinetobacter baumannii]MDC5449776.1 restriction endonuclease [Acinetobacter baumannii]